MTGVTPSEAAMQWYNAMTNNINNLIQRQIWTSEFHEK